MMSCTIGMTRHMPGILMKMNQPLLEQQAEFSHMGDSNMLLHQKQWEFCMLNCAKMELI